MRICSAGPAAVGSALRRRNVRRFAVAEPDAATVIVLLAGATLAGAEPCQYQPDTDARDLRAEARALGHTVLVTRRRDVDGGQDLDIILLDDFGRDEQASPVALRDDAARSRSSSAPPGPPVRQKQHATTGVLVAYTVAGVRRRPEQRWLLAYGPHQFAGIQVLLHVLASQATLVAPFPLNPRTASLP